MKGMLSWLGTQKGAAGVAAVVSTLVSVLAPALGVSPEGVSACLRLVGALVAPGVPVP